MDKGQLEKLAQELIDDSPLANNIKLVVRDIINLLLKELCNNIEGVWLPVEAKYVKPPGAGEYVIWKYDNGFTIAARLQFIKYKDWIQGNPVDGPITHFMRIPK